MPYAVRTVADWHHYIPAKCKLTIITMTLLPTICPPQPPMRFLQELLSQTPAPTAAASCGSMSATSLRLNNVGNFDLNFDTYATEEQDLDTGTNLFEYSEVSMQKKLSCVLIIVIYARMHSDVPMKLQSSPEYSCSIKPLP